MSHTMDALKSYLSFCEIPWKPTPAWALVFRCNHPDGISIKAEGAPIFYIEDMGTLAWKRRGDSIYVFPKA